MALHRKFAALESLQPDIAIIPECADLDRLREKAPLFTPSNAAWIGENPNKGLGVFAFNGYEVALAENFDPSIKYVAPVRVNGHQSFNLLAVWVMDENKHFRRNGPPGAALGAVKLYNGLFGERATVVAGDFNNHVRWDKEGFSNNHANVVSVLDRMGLVSAYHASHGVGHGDVREPTHYWRDRKKDGPTFHIDYVFMPRDWVGRMREMTVGTFEEWCGSKLSDHVPLVIDIDFNEGEEA